MQKRHQADAHDLVLVSKVTFNLVIYCCLGTCLCLKGETAFLPTVSVKCFARNNSKSFGETAGRNNP